MTDNERDELAALHDEVHRRITLLADDADLDEDQRGLARSWREHVERARASAEAPLSVAFLSAVGCGKSSMIAALAGLRIDEPDEDPARWSVLPVADGRTTLGELRVAFEARDDLELEIEPMSADEIELEIRLFARDRFEAVGERGRGGASGSGGEELHELLRAWLAPKAEDRWDMLDREAKAAASASTLEQTWLARIDLGARSQPLVRRFGWDDASLRVARDQLREAFAGTLEGAPIPRRTILRVPALAELGIVELIDLQGIDRGVVPLPARADVARLVRQADVLWVIGSGFNDAPDPVSVESLEFMQGQLRPVLGLIIVDKRRGDAKARARSTRVRQCRDQLERQGLAAADLPVVSFDVRREVDALRGFLHDGVAEVRRARVEAWRAALSDADQAMAALRHVELAGRLRALDLELWWTWDAGVASAGREVIDALQGVARHLNRASIHGAQLHAAVRRKGRYAKLELNEWGAIWATVVAQRGSNDILKQLRDTADRLESSNDELVGQHLALRIEQFRRAESQLDNDMVAAWQAQLERYFRSPAAQPLWDACLARWGQGPGYVEAVANFMRDASATANLEIAVPPFEDRMPPRPRLFALQQVHVTNFRGIPDRSIHLASMITAIIGDNGLGKTGWLEAIAAAVGAFLPGVGAGPAPTLEPSDVRTVIRMLGGLADRQPQLPMAIEVEGKVEGRSLAWARRIEQLPLASDPQGEGALAVLATKAGEEVRAHTIRQLPVLAYYGTGRLWPPELEAANELGGNRLDGYRDCLRAASTHQHLLSWMRKHTYAQIQNKQPYAQLQAIERAVVACVEEAVEFRYQIDLEQLVLVEADGRCLTLGMLSDGYRNIVAMVADIAWRACTLNPHLRARAPALAEGVVLIDEIDLHLHPKWQRRVLGDLHRAFPRIQFIVTTHSPFIVQSLQDGQLVNLDADVPGGAYANESPEDIVERQMGVDLPQRSERRRREYEVAKRYYELLDQMSLASAGEIASIKDELDQIIAPYSDNQAFVAFLERKRLLQAGKGS